MTFKAKLFLSLIIVQTLSMGLLLIASIYGIYKNYILLTGSHSDRFVEYVSDDIITATMFNDSNYIQNYLNKLSDSLNVARSNVIHSVRVESKYDELLASKTIKTTNIDLQPGLVHRIFVTFLGDYFRTQKYPLYYDDEYAGSMTVTVSNMDLLNKFIQAFRYIMAFWLFMIFASSILYSYVVLYITRSKGILEEIVLDLEKGSFDKNRLNNLAEDKDLAKVITSLGNVQHNILEDSKINKKQNIQKSILLTNIINRLLTPLNAITGAVDLLEARDEKDQQKLNFIEKSTNSLLNQITNTLTYIEMQELGKKVVKSPCVMSDIINLSYHGAKRNIKSDHSLSMKLINKDKLGKVYVNTDPKRFKLVIDNLIENSIDFTDKGTITVELESKQVGERFIQYNITVSDTGIGIHPEKLERIRKTLQSSETNVQTKGDSLGLVISNIILEKLNGKMFIESKYQEGTSVTVEIMLEKTSISRVL